MKTKANCYHGYRFPREIISHGVWLYHRFSLSFRSVEELLAKRGIIVSYETIRQWCRKFGPEYARQLKRRQGRPAGLDRNASSVSERRRQRVLAGLKKAALHRRDSTGMPRALARGDGKESWRA